MTIPVECKRKRSIVVQPAFINALKQACNWKKAERLPDDSFHELYIGNHMLDALESTDNQIIWGRRGTGKTHLLKAFTQKINTDPDNRKMAFYISCDKICIESPLEVKFDSDTEKMKYYAKQTFRGFVTNLVEQMIETYEKLLSSKYFYNEVFDSTERDNIKKSVEKQLFSLLENCTYGIPLPTSKKATETNSNLKERKHNNSIDAEIKGSLSVRPNFMALLKAKIGHSSAKTTSTVDSDEVVVSKVYSFSIQKARATLAALLDALQIDTMYICMDELWLIDVKRELNLQPLFLEYLRQVFLASHKISIKIASIREVTKLNSKTSAGSNYGLQSGHDILEIANLDLEYITRKDLLKHYQSMLYARINYFCRRENRISDEYLPDYIINTVFKDNKNLISLIILSHLIPRNFLYLLQKALTTIDWDLNHYFIHSYLIRQTVIEMYKMDKRSNLPMNEGSLFDIIGKYVTSTYHNFFLLSSEHAKRLKTEVDNLIYIEIIHQVPSSILPIQVMDTYKGFYIDSGKYLHALMQKQSNVDESVMYNFSYILPKSITENITDYIINVDDVESNFAECPNCGNSISKKHPVYIKATMCPVCAFKL